MRIVLNSWCTRCSDRGAHSAQFLLHINMPTVTVSPLTPSDFAEAVEASVGKPAVKGLMQALRHGGSACRVVAFGSGFGAR